jgi:hypothetical protein
MLQSRPVQQLRMGFGGYPYQRYQQSNRGILARTRIDYCAHLILPNLDPTNSCLTTLSDRSS